MLRRPSVSPFAVLAVALLLILAARPILADDDCEPLHLDHVGCADGAFSLVVPAIDAVPRRTRAATETMFLVDVSGSMQGASIEQARTALLHALNAFLEPAPDDVTRAPRRRRSTRSWRATATPGGPSWGTCARVIACSWKRRRIKYFIKL